MVKEFSIIKLGNQELRSHEDYCITTWLDTYSDFHYNFITEDTRLPDGSTVMEWIRGCKFIKDTYEAGRPIYAVDYIRLVVGYIIGGIIVDTDVICNARIPDEFLNSYNWMMPYDNCTNSNIVNNGSFQYSIPNLSIFKEFIDVYHNLDSRDTEVYNDIITNVILKYTDEISYNHNVEVEYCNGIILNALEYAGWDYGHKCILPREANKYHDNMRNPYVIHCSRASWMGNKFDSPDILVINSKDDTPDFNKLTHNTIIYLNTFEYIDIPKDYYCVLLGNKLPKDLVKECISDDLEKLIKYSKDQHNEIQYLVVRNNCPVCKLATEKFHYKYNIIDNEEFIHKYNITSYPTLIALNAVDEELYRYTDIDDILNNIEE